MAEHGGYRKPSSPAPVSGPGRLSRRTDGGPSNPTVPPGGNYGDRQQLERVQSAGAAAAAAQSGGGSAAPASGGAPPRPVNVFEPTRQPEQPITAGVPVGDGDDGMPDDGLDLLKAIAQAFPHPHLTRLVEQR